MFTGSKNRACDGESRADHGKRIWRVHTSTRRDEQHRQGRKTAIVEKYRNLLKKTKQARAGQIILSGILPVFGNRIQKFEEDGSQRDGEAAFQGRGSGIRRFVGQLCGGKKTCT